MIRSDDLTTRLRPVKTFRVYLIGYESSDMHKLSRSTLVAGMESADCCVQMEYMGSAVVNARQGWPIGSKWTAAFAREPGDHVGLEIGKTYECIGHELGGKIAIVREVES